MSNTYFYDPAQGHGLPHDPFKAIVAPRAAGQAYRCPGRRRSGGAGLW